MCTNRAHTRTADSRRSGMAAARLYRSLRHTGMGAALAALVFTLLTACYPRPRDPVGIAPAPGVFVRAPYLQDVDTASAVIMWMSRAPGPDSAAYRSANADEWRLVPVSDAGAGVRRARLEGLEPGAEVEYRVVSGPTRIGPLVFRTARRDPDTLRVLAFGDSGWGSPEQVRLAALMQAGRWDLGLHVGDLAYEDGTRDEFTRRHFLVYRPLLARVPLYPVPGNHDLYADGGGTYDESFHWEPPYPGARYYTFRRGAVRFVGLDTSSDTEDVRGLWDEEGRQYRWLEETLRAAREDPSTRWIVVWMHHPLYSHAFGISGHGPEIELRRALAPLLERYGVDLVVAGHDHHYERMWPVRDRRRVDSGCGPVYLLTGGGGASRYARSIHPTPLAARTSLAYHYVGLTITDEAIEGRAVDVDGGVLDEFRVLPYAGEPAVETCAG